MNRLRTRLEAGTSALDQAITAYAQIVRETLHREQEILRLRVHIAQNILYYMQAILEISDPGSAFFELYDIETPVITGSV